MRFAQEDIGPTQAKEMLEHNVNNFRSIKPWRVTAYSEDMRNGRWTLSLDPIMFNPDGGLINGQHRLLAIIRSGCTITMMVAYDVPDEVALHCDEVLPRSIADWLRHLRIPNAILMAAIPRLIICHNRNRWDWNQVSNTFISKDEIVSYCVQHEPQLQQAVHIAKRALSAKLGIRQSIIGAIMYLGSANNCPQDSVVARWFVDSLVTGANLKDTDPVYHLRERALVQASSPVKRWHPEHERAILCYAWNKTIMGEPLKQLKVSATGPFKTRLQKVINESEVE